MLLFVFNWDKIRQTLEATRFSEAVSAGREGRPPVGEGKPDAEDRQPGLPVQPVEPSASADPSPVVAQPSVETDPIPDQPAPSAAVKTPETTSPSGTNPASPIEQVKRTRLATLYFVKVDDDGTIRRQEIKRTVDASDSPMTDALSALLLGPSVDELSKKLISLVPSGTRLLNARVSGSTAFLDFNEAFMFNNYGIEGYAGQLTQIIYTVTSFPNIKDVQFLIEGQKREYLAGDGIYIGRPLSRSSF